MRISLIAINLSNILNIPSIIKIIKASGLNRILSRNKVAFCFLVYVFFNASKELSASLSLGMLNNRAEIPIQIIKNLINGSNVSKYILAQIKDIRILNINGNNAIIMILSVLESS